MNLASARSALKTAIAGTMPAVDLTASPEAPCAIVMPRAPFEWHQVFGDDASESIWTVLILMPWGDNASAQSDLDTKLASVSAAIEALPSATIERLEAYGVDTFHDGGRQYLMAELIVNVFV